MKRYTHFDFIKVMALLEQLEYEVEKDSKFYTLEVFNFAEIGKGNLRVRDVLVSEESFDEINSFYLINCGLYSGGKEVPDFFFRMGERMCHIDYTADEKHSIYGDSWRIILATFIFRINHLVENELKLQHGYN